MWREKKLAVIWSENSLSLYLLAATLYTAARGGVFIAFVFVFIAFSRVGTKASPVIFKSSSLHS